MVPDILIKGPNLTGQRTSNYIITSRPWGRGWKGWQPACLWRKNPRIHLSQHKGLVRGDGPHKIEAVGLTGDDACSTQCLLETLEVHCKPRNNIIVTAAAYNQLEQGDLGLLGYIEKCKDVTAAWHFGIAYDKCLPNTILLGLRNQWVYEKCIEVGDQLTSIYVIWVVSEVYN